MNTVTVSATTPSSQIFSSTSGLPSASGGAVSGNGGSVQSVAASRMAVVDSVDISGRSRLAAEAREGVVAYTDDVVVRNDAEIVRAPEEPAAAAAKVEFDYDNSGEKVMKFMDNSDRLVYQLPSELTLQLRESTDKADHIVNTMA